MVFCSLIASSAIRAFISALKLRRCLDFIPAPFPRPRFYTLLTGPNFGEHLRLPRTQSEPVSKHRGWTKDLGLESSRFQMLAGTQLLLEFSLVALISRLLTAEKLP